MPKSTLVNLQTHDNMVRKRGDIVWWYRHRKCTCAAGQKNLDRTQDEARVTQDSLRARPACPICKGNGYWWTDDVIKLKAVCMDVSVANSRELLAAGLAAPGDMVMLPAPLGMREYQFNDFDKIIFPNRSGQPYDGDVIVRGQFANGGVADLLAYPAGQIESVTWHNTAALVPTVVTCEAGVDYEWTARSNQIRWLGTAKEPPEGMPYAVAYRAYFEWILFLPPNVRFEADNSLGARMLLKKKHVLGWK